jgi:TPR repeat protein
MRRIFSQTCRAAIVLWLALSAVAAQPATFEDGVAAYNRGDHAAARSLWQRLADDGDVSAQTNLGYMLEHGEGGPRDAPGAVTWYRRAAGRGSLTAQYNLGAMYYRGEGIPRDAAEAAKWFLVVAERGYPRAQHNMAVLYETGEGVPRDDVEAYVWFALAAAGFGSGQDGDDAARDRDKVGARMKPERLDEARRLLARRLSAGASPAFR